MKLRNETNESIYVYMSTLYLPSKSFDPYQLGYFLFVNEYANSAKFLCQKINDCSHANIDSLRFQSTFSQYKIFR